jgi:transcriptional regulator with XRE-family HTH domain
MTDTHQTLGPWAQGGTELAALRAALEITQAELSEQAGLPGAAWVADVEAGRRPVPSVFYRPMAREFGMDTAVFATLCLKHYDPKAHDALFGAADAPVLKVAA